MTMTDIKIVTDIPLWKFLLNGSKKSHKYSRAEALL